MANVHIELTTEDIKQLIREHLVKLTGNENLSEGSLTIMVKSKQNFKAEWEAAEFKAVYDVILK